MLRQLPAGLWLVAAATLINRAGTMVQPFLVLYLTKSVGMGAELAGAMVAVWGIGSLVSAPIAGRLCDLFGARAMMIVSMVGSGFIMLVYPLAESTVEVVIATALLALIGDAARPASMSLFGELAPEGQGKAAFALQRLAVNLGMAVGPVVGGMLAERWFAALFYVDGVTALVAAAVVAVWVLRTPATPRPEAAPSSQPSPPSRRAFSDGPLLYFLFASLLSALVFFQIDAAMPLYLVRDLGLTEQQFGLLFAINPVLIILLEVPINAATEKWPMRRSLTLGATLVAVGFASTGLAVGIWSALPTVVLWTFGEMVLFPASAAYVSELAPAHRRGEYMGAFSMAFSLAHTVAPVSGTFTLERMGPATLWGGCLVVGLVGAALFASVPEPDRGNRD